MTRKTGVWALAASLLVGCGRELPEVVVGDVELALSLGTAQPNLHTTADGQVVLTWLERIAGRRYALRAAMRSAAGWSQPTTAVESERLFVNWADFPSLVELADGGWLVHWLELVPGGKYAYHVKLAVSRDGGSTWGASITPHRDTSPTEHGFVSMVPLEDSTAALVWLDGRGMAVGDAAGDELDRGAMSVRATTVGSAGELGPEVLLDDRTCECCQTALVQTAQGLVAAYRDRSEDEIRDIAVVRRVGGSWTDPAHVWNDNWYYPGCPVNGPQLSALGDTVVVAWFTAPERKPAVYVAYSFDAGASFGMRARVDEGDALGRVDVEILSDGSALVSWLERTPSAAEIRVRRMRPDGSSAPSVRVAGTAESRASGFPRMARAGDEIVIAWTSVGAGAGEASEPGEEGIRVATLRAKR